MFKLKIVVKMRKIIVKTVFKVIVLGLCASMILILSPLGFLCTLICRTLASAEDALKCQTHKLLRDINKKKREWKSRESD